MTMTDEQALAAIDVALKQIYNPVWPEDAEAAEVGLREARAHIAARLSEAPPAAAVEGGGVDYCQMDWTPLNQHTKRWTCRVCKKVKDANSADGHPLTWCAAPPADSAGVTELLTKWKAESKSLPLVSHSGSTLDRCVRELTAALSAARGK